MVEYISIVLLCILASAIIFRATRIIDATQRKRLITEDIAGCCESLGFVGCSVICSNVSSLEHIEELLGQEYDRYEVVVTLDAQSYANEFREIVTRYRMIRVNCSASEELPTAAVRALYRSRQRSFRRLILIDKATSDLYDDLDTATAIASYDFILPVGQHTHLCPKAIECIAIILSEPIANKAEMLYSKATDSYVFRRDSIITNGGFSQHIIRQIPSSAHLSTYIPLTFSTKNQPHTLLTIVILVALLLAVQLLAGTMANIAAISTLIMIFAISRYISTLINPTNCSFKVALCYFRKMTPIFQSRKFLI